MPGATRRNPFSAVLPVLFRAVESPEKQDRLHALRALEALGPHAVSAATMLLELVRSSPDPDRKRNALYDYRGICESAINALGAIGRAASDAVPALAEILHGKRTDLGPNGCLILAGWAAGSLGDIASREAIQALIEAARIHPPDSSLSACEIYWALGRQGRAAKAAIPVLEGLLEDPRSLKFRGNLLNAIEDLRGPGKRGAAWRRKFATCEGFSRWGSGAFSEAMPVLLRVLEEGRREDRFRALWSESSIQVSPYGPGMALSPPSA